MKSLIGSTSQGQSMVLPPLNYSRQNPLGGTYVHDLSKTNNPLTRTKHLSSSLEYTETTPGRKKRKTDLQMRGTVIQKFPRDIKPN